MLTILPIIIKDTLTGGYKDTSPALIYLGANSISTVEEFTFVRNREEETKIKVSLNTGERVIVDMTMLDFVKLYSTMGTVNAQFLGYVRRHDEEFVYEISKLIADNKDTKDATSTTI